MSKEDAMRAKKKDRPVGIKKVKVRRGPARAEDLRAHERTSRLPPRTPSGIELAKKLASEFVASLRGGSDVHREQLRRIAASCIIGRRQALDALCRLRMAGLIAEDLAGLGREELCGEWTGLWRLIERRSSEMEADEREAALAGDAEARPRERSDRHQSALIKMEGRLAEAQNRIKELESGQGVADARPRLLL